VLSIDALDVYYGETQVLFGVSLGVAAGEVVALLGPNGAGKTTTLRAILGLTPARRGKVVFDGEDVTRAPTHEIARRGLSWVPDDRRVFPSLTAARNLSIAQRRTRFEAWPVERCCELFPALRTCCRASARTCRAASCRWCRSRARWSARRASCCSTSRRRGSRPRSCRT
jgi:branched-chain amino acid transport system ATP-binding protein